jgi:hypothetical protein
MRTPERSVAAAFHIMISAHVQVFAFLSGLMVFGQESAD